MTVSRTFLIALLIPLSFLFNCAEDLAPVESTDDQNEWVDEYGLEGPFDLAAPLGKPDMVSGPRISWENTDTVWEIEHQWADVTAEAGLAWDADSGLNFEQKYRAWVHGLPTVDRERGGTTFQLTTPEGVILPAPALECAEVSIFLRATFASWHGLPFYMRASKNGSPIYLGHFGFRNSDGSRFQNTRNFRSRYTDYTDSWSTGDDWPSDTRLRARGLYGGGDEVSFLPEVDGKTAQAGAYFDALYLNKRTGHFMLMVLSWFGSANLADSSNMMALIPEKTQPGDVLLHRWQRRGIGHTIPVLRVTSPMEGRLDIGVATGSMPRRQPTWEEGADARWYFISDDAGSPETNSDGDLYSELGGGIRRWRTPVAGSTRYSAGPLVEEANFIISPSNLPAIGARVQRFEEILATVTPEQMREAALNRIAAARAHLSDHPSSCSARERREQGFTALYELMLEEFQMNADEVDARYRVLSDYVFAELVYNQSRSCCWNSTTRAMYEIIMHKAEAEQLAAEQNQECTRPTVFMGRDNGSDGDGFQLYQAYADSIERGDEWVSWSADESCGQSGNANDVEKAHTWTAFCSLPVIEDEPPPTTCEDGNDFPTSATPIGADPIEATICSDSEADFFQFEVTGTQVATIDLSFQHSVGDLDLLLQTSAGIRVASSASTNDTEHISTTLQAGTYVIKVYGYSGATGDYTLTTSLETTALGEGCGDAGRDRTTAVAIDGNQSGLRICAGEQDWWLYTAPQAGDVTITITFQNSVGDLDMAIFGDGDAALNTSQTTSDQEQLVWTAASGESVIISVYGYSGATGDYDIQFSM